MLTVRFLPLQHHSPRLILLAAHIARRRVNCVKWMPVRRDICGGGKSLRNPEKSGMKYIQVLYSLTEECFSQVGGISSPGGI